MQFRRRAVAVLSAGVLAAAMAACSSDSGESEGDSTGALTLYSGRSENLVAPLIDQLEGTLGFEIDVVYGSTPEITGKLVEEGASSPADVVFTQDAGALGLLDQAGLLETLPASVTDLVPADYRAADGTWVATSARARVLVYNDQKVQPQDLPTGIDGLLDPKWKGQIGFAPTNASFQAFVTGLRVARGEDGARAWLEGFKANEPVAFEGNGPLMEGVDTGQVTLGLTNHYYWYGLADERGAENLNVQVYYFQAGDPGALVNIAGAGVVQTTDQKEQAEQFVAALLSPEAQTYFADETSEYPVVEGVETKDQLRPLSEIGNADIELAELASLEQTQALLQELGFI
ncbi:iron ABC transporter substrate-binding protein [Rhodococcus rhodochrous]|uniref:Iron ABC transporter substrate-binding protein n=1 Tax=Rhodococcus rhodochrous KG-21 TaxID=1441923 RepID=A0A0M9WPJ3_RHORH|nr:iron ABC transporter substrate-binding protein [Rhodococcus rhodochrous]KOS56761.1 iron ABC transporter substrate-binding protein [Rhodococcus rhodochrous KG-21]